MLTFYDIFSGPNNKNSLSLSAKEYLELLNTDNDTFDKYANYPANMEGYREWVSVIDANNGYFPNYDPKGNVYFVKASFANNYDCDIYFVDINNEIVTYDNHNDGFYNSARNGKDYRSFYITPTYGLDENGNITILKDAPKIKKIIIAYRNRKVNAYPSVTIETATDYEAKNQAFKDYPVTDVISKTNKWTFKTSFEKQRAVVTRLAYEDGFTLKMTDATGKKQKVDVFNGQGGFVSFLSGTGDCSYELEFYTPYLKIGSYISMVGVLVFSSTLLGYLYIDLRRKEKECLQFGI